MKILKSLFLWIIVLVSVINAEDCTSRYNCTRSDARGEEKTNLYCYLPAMPTFRITAPDIIANDGGLRRFWGFSGDTVCDVLGWMS